MQRTCVGCRSVNDPAELVRLVLGLDGEVVVDLARGSFGRGVWVHPTVRCIEKAVPAGLSRGFRANVRTTPAEVVERLAQAAVRRVQGLLIGARGARKLEAGATVVEESVLHRRAELVLVATDARASAELPWLGPLVASGRAVAFGEKALFGSWLARKDTALLAVTDVGIARELKEAISWTMLQGPRTPSEGVRRAVSSEAG
jgi:predicted RNA-binding protein YlxR (DUF448 family)